MFGIGYIVGIDYVSLYDVGVKDYYRDLSVPCSEVAAGERKKKKIVHLRRRREEEPDSAGGFLHPRWRLP